MNKLDPIKKRKSH